MGVWPDLLSNGLRLELKNQATKWHPIAWRTLGEIFLMGLWPDLLSTALRLQLKNKATKTNNRHWETREDVF